MFWSLASLKKEPDPAPFSTDSGISFRAARLVVPLDTSFADTMQQVLQEIDDPDRYRLHGEPGSSAMPCFTVSYVPRAYLNNNLPDDGRTSGSQRFPDKSPAAAMHLAKSILESLPDSGRTPTTATISRVALFGPPKWSYLGVELDMPSFGKEIDHMDMALEGIAAYHRRYGKYIPHISVGRVAPGALDLSVFDKAFIGETVTLSEVGIIDTKPSDWQPHRYGTI